VFENPTFLAAWCRLNCRDTNRFGSEQSMLEFGLGVSTLFDQHSITKISFDTGTTVTESIKDTLSKV